MDFDASSTSSFSLISPPSSPPSTPASFSDWLSPSFYSAQYSYDYDDDLYYCPCCSPRCQESITADLHEARDSHLWEFEPYRDLRSAARGKNRYRTIRENKRSYNDSYRGRMAWQAEKRMRNKREKKGKLRDGVEVCRAERVCYTRAFRRAKHNVVQWDVHLDEEFDEWVRCMDDVERYTRFRTDAEIFEAPEPYIEVGENFATWCQRRVAEMRSVKESRVRRGEPEMIEQSIWHSKIHPRYRRRCEVYIGDATTTTLPTNAYDALGHELLRSLLSPARWWAKRARIPNASLFRAGNNYRWFGEYDWQWYRNESGCWEIGFGGQIAAGYSTSCDYCNGWCAVDDSWSENMSVVCHFNGRRIMPAPEEMQRCSLVDWVGEEGREIILGEEIVAMKRELDAMYEESVQGRELEVWGDAIKEIKEEDRGVDVGMEEYRSEVATWDMVSMASSETWSVVDADN